MKTDTFKTYVGNYIYGPGQPTVIITANTKVQPIIYAESFIFLEGDDPVYDEKRICLDITDVPRKIAEWDLNTMLNEALSQAENMLSRLLYEYFKKNDEAIYLSQNFILKESDEQAIIRLIMRNRFPNKIEKVKNITMAESLREVLREYANIPKIQFQTDLK